MEAKVFAVTKIHDERHKQKAQVVYVDLGKGLSEHMREAKTYKKIFEI